MRMAGFANMPLICRIKKIQAMGKQTPLSPQKYIQTKARTLPIHKCLINKGWQESGIANVWVMRRHVNGHVTAGLFLVDLFCLGVKHTIWFFNEPEENIFDRLPEEAGDEMEELEYATAHNIIYAAHDFAMDYDIHPHKGFELTKYILEEDDDRIPLVEIPVGDNGVPHLIVREANQYLDALAKLRKNAGEGNYLYTIDGFNDDDEEDEETDEDEEEFAVRDIESVPLGEINCLSVQMIKLDDLIDEEKTKHRGIEERVIINMECMLRLLPEDIRFSEDGDQALIDQEWDELDNLGELESGTSQEVYDEALAKGQEWEAIEQQDIDEDEKDRQVGDLISQWLAADVTNPILMRMVLEQVSVGSLDHLKTPVISHLEKLTQYPIIELALAYHQLAAGLEMEERFSHIYTATNIRGAFPGYPQFSPLELSYFSATKVLYFLKEDNFRRALQYYDIMAETARFEFQLLPLFQKLIESLIKEIGLDDEG